MGRILIILSGLAVLWIGISELQLRWESRSEPTEYSLAALEEGAVVSNLNGMLDSHWALFDAMVFTYQTRRDKPPEENDTVSGYCYPVVSKLPAAPGEKVEFRVVVRDHRARKVRDLPSGVEMQPAVSGLFLRGVKGKDRELLQAGFPHVDFDKVLLFEVGRKRKTVWDLLFCFLAGPALIYGAVRFKKSEKVKVTQIDNRSPGA